MKHITHNNGYTIIETMIAISLLLVVTMTGIGALLNANLLHEKSRSTRSIMDNLSFILEDMSRNLRVGYNYHCVDDGNFKTETLLVAKSCSNGGGIAFEHSLGNSNSDTDQWVYKIESEDGGDTFHISKSTDSGVNWVKLNPPEVTIDAVSGFSVLGAEAPDEETGVGDHQQPFVTIKLVGSITFKNVSTPFSLQTSVSQRLIDI